MNYEDFIVKYPWFDLFWEVFKGIMPTIIALLAIYINNKKANGRDKEKLVINALLLLQDNINNLNNMIYNTGKDCLSYLQYLDDSKVKEIYFNRYNESNNELLLFSRKVRFLVDIERFKFNIKSISFDECYKKIAYYTYKICDIIDEYNEKVRDIDRKEANKILDDVQQKLLKISEETEKEMFNYAMTLSKVITGLNKKESLKERIKTKIYNLNKVTLDT